MTVPFDPLHSIFDTVASGKKQKAIFDAAFDKLLGKINFDSEAESIHPNNVAITKQAFIEFLHDIGAPLSLWGFEELLEEKSGKEAFRADGITPNWYHEFRNVLWNLSKFRTGMLRLRDFQLEGGIDVFIASVLLHDSWEDFGKSPEDIFKILSQRISAAPIDAVRQSGLMECAYLVGQNVDYATRKIPARDAHGNFVLKPTGRIVKEDRFGGDMNIYFDKLLKSPVTCLLKFEDANEGMATRIGVENFSIEDDRKYTGERRALFGSRPFDDESIEAYPFLARAIRNSDGMLGILLREMETQLYYVPEPNKTYQDPSNGRPIGISDYMPHALEGYKILPVGWQPEMIFLERMETKAKNETDNHHRKLLDFMIYPALNGYYPRPKNHVPILGDETGWDFALKDYH